MAELRQCVTQAEVSLPLATDCGASSQPTGNLEATPERRVLGRCSAPS